MALTPEYLQKCSDEIDRLFWQLGTKILVDIADRIRHAGGMTSTAEYLNEKLRVFGLQQSMINELIAVALKTEQSEVDKLMAESTAKSTRQLFENLVAAGYDTTGLEFRDQILKSTNVLNNELTNLTRTTAQLGSAKMMDAFDQAYLQVSSGAYSFDEAVANACQKLAREGLGMVEYPSGAHRTVEAAVRVAVRTSVNQNALQCEMDAIKKMGINLVQTSSHLGARPTHAVWQGKVFWLNTEDPRYENFYEATGYGTATGLGGYNCRHSFYPYFEELGEQTYEHFDEEKNREYYEQEQKQRYLERKVREWDRRVQILKAGGQNTAEASRWKKYYKDQLDDLVKNNNGFLKRDYAAEKAYPAIKNETDAQEYIENTAAMPALSHGQEQTIESGGIRQSGGLNPDSKEAQMHANMYYELVRHMRTDCKRIAKNTGYPVELIRRIKRYVFEDAHDLVTGHERFYPSYRMGESWRRLIDGKEIQPHDITLLNHELYESILVKDGLTVQEAHDKTELIYNYAKETDEYYASRDKKHRRRRGNH